jgi:signal transduction histidine kinase
MSRGGALGRLYAILGAPGLLIGLFALLSFGFGLVVLVREYDRLRATGRQALRPVLAGWVRAVPVNHLRWTLADSADVWRRAAPADRPARRDDLERDLEVLGRELDGPARRTALVEVVALELAPRGGAPLASWRAPAGPPAPTDLADRFELLPAGPSGPAIDLALRYRLAPEVERAARGLEVSYHRLLMALLGLSGYSLLCLVYMILNARALRDRVARESAQAATLDLADRTCHELGNVAFVLSNERRNLADHLGLVSRFVAEEPDALAAASRRAGLDPSQAERLRAALRREYAERGIDPDVELRGGAAIAADVCRQVAVCSDYIALTVRELDAYLKQSSLPVAPEPIAPDACLSDALALLGPALESSGARVDRPGPASPRIVADRRLLVHALVNLIKNAIEAASSAGRTPHITLSTRADGPTLWIEVTDDGPGIPADALSRVYDLGYSTKGPGRGRGLAIVRESILAQRGQLRVDSQVGRGTVFRIGLPLAEGGRPQGDSPLT